MKILAVVVIVLAGVATVAAAHEAGIGPFSSSLPITLQSPTLLAQTVGTMDKPLSTGAWTNHWDVHVSVAKPTSANMRLQIEYAKNGAPAPNIARVTAPIGPTRNKLTLTHLSGGTYKWWARFYDGSAISRWTPFSAGVAFKIDTTRPTLPVVTSSTDPSQTQVYRSGNVSFNWASTDQGSGINQYRYSFGRPDSATPVLTSSLGYSTSGLSTGDYVLNVQAQDRAGNWSLPSSYVVKLDSTAPSISDYGFSTFAFNPHYSTMTFNYLVTQPATVRIGIYSQSSGQRERLIVRHATHDNELLHYTWKGRDDHSHIVPAGQYSFVVRTTDSYGNTHLSTYSNLRVLDRVIIISLTQQKLWAYQDGHSVLSSLVTTGNINCCATPPGTYTILASSHPFTFVSPEPAGSYYWYPDSKVEYALLFQKRGFYIHDAPWRSVFGPGTNKVAGVPGSPETGSHGCVNTPLNVAQFLYGWAPIGTPVRVLK